MVAPPSQPVVVNTPQLILTPGGLMQALAGPLPAVQEVNKQLSPSFTAQRKRGREAKKSRPKKKMKASSSDTSLEQEGAEGVDETDTSFEEPQPSTSKSSIQSNQVDSSGLNATPPHYKEGEFEQLRSCSPPGPGSEESFLELSSSLDTSRHSKLSGASTPASNLSLQEEKLTDYDSDLDLEPPGPKIVKAVSSSSKKKKKKKKR